MHKKHIFLRIFQKITLFACVFCAVPAWSETTCDIDFTPVTGNSWQNSTPTPTSPVEIESIGTKVGNKYAVQVAVNYDGGVVDMGSLDWNIYQNTTYNKNMFYSHPLDGKGGAALNFYSMEFHGSSTLGSASSNYEDGGCYMSDSSGASLFRCYADKYNNMTTDAFKQAMSGKMLYYQRATDETWTAPTLKTVYLDEPLRKVGDYADVLDYKNGTITRNVGVKVLDGTETWVISTTTGYTMDGSTLFWNVGSIQDNASISHGDEKPAIGISNYFIAAPREAAISTPKTIWSFSIGSTYHSNHTLWIRADGDKSVSEWKQWLAERYANGTPVTIYYPLATPVVEQIENWSCIPPISDIKIATTKMVDEEFAVAEANLAATVQTIESVVSRTIAQTGQIQVLQDTKQTRPDENCPANMKCLLVQDEDGTPHWYPIIEP